MQANFDRGSASLDSCGLSYPFQVMHRALLITKPGVRAVAVRCRCSWIGPTNAPPGSRHSSAGPRISGTTWPAIFLGNPFPLAHSLYSLLSSAAARPAPLSLSLAGTQFLGDSTQDCMLPARLVLRLRALGPLSRPAGCPA